MVAPPSQSSRAEIEIMAVTYLEGPYAHDHELVSAEGRALSQARGPALAARAWLARGVARAGRAWAGRAGPGSRAAARVPAQLRHGDRAAAAVHRRAGRAVRRPAPRGAQRRRAWRRPSRVLPADLAQKLLLLLDLRAGLLGRGGPARRASRGSPGWPPASSTPGTRSWPSGSSSASGRCCSATPACPGRCGAVTTGPVAVLARGRAAAAWRCCPRSSADSPR